MAEYVSREELRKFFEGIVITVGGRTRAEAISQVLKAVYNGVMELPTTDAVPVIRCKSCKHHGTNGYRLNCAVFCCTMPDDGFCSGGERREDETD